MPRSVFEPAERAALLARIARLGPESRPRWGTLNVARMLCHIKDTFGLATGAVTCRRAAAAALVSRFPAKQLFLYVLPFPKGVRGPRKLFVTQPAAFERDRVELVEALEAYGSRGQANPSGDHPLFGRLTPREWGVLVHKHTAHHLSQFGV